MRRTSQLKKKEGVGSQVISGFQQRARRGRWQWLEMAGDGDGWTDGWRWMEMGEMGGDAGDGRENAISTYGN